MDASFTLRPLYLWKRPTTPIQKEGQFAPQPAWAFRKTEKYIATAGIFFLY
jgi:hypothetical protein